MLFKKKNQFRDERIEKEGNKLMAPMFYLFSFGLLACLVLKLVLGEPWYNYILEILCLVPSWSYLLIAGISKGVLFVREKDEVLASIRNEIMSKAYMISFWIIIFGELIYAFFVMRNMMLDHLFREMDIIWIGIYMAAWLISAVIISVFTVRKGWLIWGSRKREATGKKELAKRTAIGALFFGLIMGAPKLVENGAFQPKGLLDIVVIGALWGIMFYFMMIWLMKISEKNADKAVKEQEINNEESEDEISQS